MLSCFQGPTNIVFQKILKFFVKQNSLILDMTYGRGLSWQDIQEKYNLTKVDKRKLFDDVIKSDFKDYLKEIKDSSFNCLYFDPPYYFKEKIKNFNIKDLMLNHDEEVFWTEKEFRESLEILKKEVPRILKDRGIFIVKIMDGYIGKEYYPNAFEIFNIFTNIMIPRGIFICPIQRKDTIIHFIRENHIYYIVFQKEEIKNGKST